MMSVSFDGGGDVSGIGWSTVGTEPCCWRAVPSRAQDPVRYRCPYCRPAGTPQEAILGALRDGFTTKTSCLREAYARRASEERYTTLHELECTWGTLVHQGHIVRDGRNWRCA